MPSWRPIPRWWPRREHARVAVGGAADGSLPAIELVTGNGIAIIHEDDLDPADLEELRARFAGTGLDRVGLETGPRPRSAPVDSHCRRALFRGRSARCRSAWS